MSPRRVIVSRPIPSIIFVVLAETSWDTRTILDGTLVGLPKASRWSRTKGPIVEGHSVRENVVDDQVLTTGRLTTGSRQCILSKRRVGRGDDDRGEKDAR